jgi:hypothetical protein
MSAEQDTPSERPTFDVKAPAGGWLYPWPNVAELAGVLPTHQWTLIGGLMTQLHAVHRGVDAVRPTNDVDIVLHIETTRGMPNATADALEKIGYTIKESIDPRNNVAHRFTRATTHIDVVTSAAADVDADATDGDGAGANGPASTDVVDVVVADHPAPSVEEQMRRRDMMKIEGGTQALRRTANYRLEIVPGEIVTISAPRPFGATILKAAAYKTDTRDRDRHLQDAAVLLACIEDPEAEREGFIGNDRSRLLTLERELVDEHVAWRLMPETDARRGQAVLRLLMAPD